MRFEELIKKRKKEILEIREIFTEEYFNINIVFVYVAIVRFAFVFSVAYNTRLSLMKRVHKIFQIVLG